MPSALSFQLDLAVRLLIAAFLGALIGLEREIHEHPAGMRTHLLVALGSAIFTEMSFAGFGQVLKSGQATNIDPTRIAAQIVAGIGFLGAGAILKYGTTIRGLTTAASLWVTAAVGMAAGAGEQFVALIGVGLAILSLWPLNAIVDRLRLRNERSMRMRLALGRLELLGRVSSELSSRRVEISGIQSQRLGKGRYEVELDLRLPSGVRPPEIVGAVTSLPEVELIEAAGIKD